MALRIDEKLWNDRDGVPYSFMGAFPALYFNAKVQRTQRNAKSQNYAEV